jgi:hypothetical protein
MLLRGVKHVPRCSLGPALPELAAVVLLEGAKAIPGALLPATHFPVSNYLAVFNGVGPLRWQRSRHRLECSDIGPGIIYPHLWVPEVGYAPLLGDTLGEHTAKTSATWIGFFGESEKFRALAYTYCISRRNLRGGIHLRVR